MTYKNVKMELHQLIARWPATHKVGGTEAFRDALQPYDRLSDVPLDEIPALLTRFRALTYEASFRWAKPDPAGAASLMLS